MGEIYWKIMIPCCGHISPINVEENPVNVKCVVFTCGRKAYNITLLAYFILNPLLLPYYYAAETESRYKRSVLYSIKLIYSNNTTHY